MKHIFLDKEEDYNMWRNFKNFQLNPRWRIARGVLYNFYVSSPSDQHIRIQILMDRDTSPSPISYIEKYKTSIRDYRIPVSLLYMLLKEKYYDDTH